MREFNLGPPTSVIGMPHVQLVEVLVPLSDETNKLIGGLSRRLLGSVVQGSPLLNGGPEPAVIRPLGPRGPLETLPGFELVSVPKLQPSAFSLEEEAEGEPARPSIRGLRRGRKCRRGATNQPPEGYTSPVRRKRGEVPAQWSANNPPVATQAMRYLPDNTFPPRLF